MSYPNGGTFRRQARREQDAINSLSGIAVRQGASSIELSDKRVEFDRHHQEGLFVLTVKNGPSDSVQNTLESYAGAFGLAVQRSAPGQDFTVTGTVDKLAKLVNGLSQEGHLKTSGTKELLLSKLRSASGEAVGREGMASVRTS